MSTRHVSWIMYISEFIFHVNFTFQVEGGRVDPHHLVRSKFFYGHPRAWACRWCQSSASAAVVHPVRVVHCGFHLWLDFLLHLVIAAYRGFHSVKWFVNGCNLFTWAFPSGLHLLSVSAFGVATVWRDSSSDRFLRYSFTISACSFLHCHSFWQGWRCTCSYRVEVRLELDGVDCSYASSCCVDSFGPVGVWWRAISGRGKL